MGEDNNRIKLLASLFVATIMISSGFFLMDVFDYVGTISSSNIDVFIADIMITPSGNEVQITLTFVITNPTMYSRIKLNSIYYQLFLNLNGSEESIARDTYFSRAQLIPHKETSFKATVSISKAKEPFIETHSPTSELQWRVNCFIHFETPIKRYYQTVNIYIPSTASPQ